MAVSWRTLDTLFWPLALAAQLPAADGEGAGPGGGVRGGGRREGGRGAPTPRPVRGESLLP
jgi:hypothetical protein